MLRKLFISQPDGPLLVALVFIAIGLFVNASVVSNSQGNAIFFNPETWIAIFTFLLTGATLALWSVTRSILLHTKMSSEQQLRAYVGVRERTLEYRLSERELTCFLRVKNFGQTPAMQIKDILACQVDSYPTPMDVPEFEFDPDDGLSYLAPSDEMVLYCDLDVEESDYESVLQGRKAIWMFGVIEYVDAFGMTRNTSFRYFMTGGDIKGKDRKMNVDSCGNEAN